MANCIRMECGAVLDDDGVCQQCGEGSKLAEVPDYEAGRLFDEWFFSIPRADMEQLAEAGTMQEAFDQWCADRATKH